MSEISTAQSCVIDSIRTDSMTGCRDNLTVPQWDDDYFRIYVTVYFHNAPPLGELELSGFLLNQPEVAIITNPNATSHTFENLRMKADIDLIPPAPQSGQSFPINVTARFIGTNCSLNAFDIGINGANAPRPCSVPIAGEGYINQYASVDCWPYPTDVQNCNRFDAYVPNPELIEHLPIKYIRVVVHVLQREAPLSPENFTSADASLISDMFNHPSLGLNAFYGNLCDSPNDNVPVPISDSRIRFVNNAEEGVDLFFHQDNEGWATGLVTCGSGYTYMGTSISTLEDTYIDPLTNLDSRNAFHVFLPGTVWCDFASGPNQGIIGTEDILKRCGGGFTSRLNNCTDPPRAIINGIYQFYKIMIGVDSNICGLTLPKEPETLGGSFVGELFHILGLDHISPLQAHVVGGDFCDDTPWIDPYNKMGDGQEHRCALTPCQVGRIHWTLSNSDIGLERFLVSTNPDVYSMTPSGYCDISEPDLVIPSGYNVEWEFPRQIRSNVLVKSGGKLTVRCDVGLPRDATITVEKQGQLTVVGARLYNNCDGEHWQGIIVQGDPNLTQDYDIFNQTYYQGRVRLQSGTVIEKAKTGVSSVGGGIVAVSGTQFLNCLNRAAEIRNFQNWNINNGRPKGNASYFNGCKFVADNNYAGSMVSDFYEMIGLQKVDGIQVQGCTFENTAIANYQNDRKFGLKATNAGFSVGELCTIMPCIGAVPSSFTGFDRGIFVDNNVGIRNFSVSNSNFSDNVVGIEAQHIRGAFVASNTFEVGCALDFTVSSQYSTKANRGLMLYDCTGYQVENNTCNLDASGAVNPVGILVNASGIEPNLVYRNKLYFMDHGNLSNGRNKHPNEPTIIRGLQYICNENANNRKHDFAVAKEGGSAGIRRDQGEATKSAGNKFSPVYPGAGQTLHFFNGQGKINYFFLNTVNQVPINIDTTQVKPIQISLGNNCPSTLPNGFHGTLDPNEKQQYEQDFNTTSNSTEKRALAADALFRHYLLDTVSIDLAATRTILTQRGDLISRFGGVDAWLQENNTTEAQAALNTIPTQFTLAGEDSVEYNYFYTLKSLQITALQNGTSDQTLVANNLSTITNLADAGIYYASSQAKSLLNSVNGFTYTPPVILPIEPQLMVSPPPGNNGQMEPASVEAQPNPAKQHTVFRYRLPEDAEQGQILVTDIDGRTIVSLVINTNTGSVEWNNIGLKEGIYFYSLVTGNTTTSTKRLVIVR
jgi:hypothetical protein